MSYVEGTEMTMEELADYLTTDPSLDIYYRYEYGISKGWYVGHLWHLAQDGLVLELTRAQHHEMVHRYDYILAEYDEADARRMQRADTSFPIICYRDSKDGKLEIADGYHRLFQNASTGHYNLDYILIELPAPDLVNGNHTESGKHYIFNIKEN